MKTIRRPILLLVKFLVSGGLLLFLFSRIDIQAMLRQFHEVDLIWLFVMLLIPHLNILLSSMKWQWLLKALRFPVGLGRLFCLYMVGTFFSNFLPTMVGGDVVRVLFLGRSHGKMTAVIAATFAERFTGVAALFTLVLLTLFHQEAITLFPQLLVVAPLLTLGFLFCLVLLFQKRWLSGFLGRTGRGFVGKGLSKLADLQNLLLEYRNNYRPVLAAYFASLLFYSLSICTVYAAGRSLGTHLEFADLLVIVPLVLIAGMLPISIGGMGINEGGYVFLLTQFGLGAPEALAIALLLRARIFLTGFLGGAVYLFFSKAATPVMAGTVLDNNAGKQDASP